MNKFFLVLLLSLQIQVLIGQNKSKTGFHFSNDTTNLVSAIELIERQSNFQFMYISSWLTDDTFLIKNDYDSIQPLLEDLVYNTSLNYFIQEEQIYLIKNFNIQEKLDPSLFGSAPRVLQNSSNTNEVAYVFARDITVQNSSDLEGTTEIQIIGNRKDANWNEMSYLTGQVKDAKNGEALPGVTVHIKNPFIGSTTDANGYYEIAIPTGQNRLFFNFIGMVPLELEVMIYSNGKLNIELSEEAFELEEIVIESNKHRNIESAQTGMISLQSKTIEYLPMAMGEPDLIKVALTLPGVQTVGEGSGGFNVRGGKADQNLVLIEGAPIYNTSHFFGFFSVINPASTNGMDLYKSGIPAQYGGRLASVMDIKIKDASMEKFSIDGGISPVTGKLNMEIPLIKNKMSALVSGRSTYSNWVLSQVDDKTFRNSAASFNDLMTKISFQLNERNTFSATGYHSHDDFQLSSDSLISMNNLAGSLIWKTNLSDTWDGRIQGSFSQYSYDMKYDRIPEDAFLFAFSVKEIQGSVALGFFPNKSHTFDMGLDIKRYELDPGKIQPKGIVSLQELMDVNNERGVESAIYLSDSWEITEKISTNLGVRYSGFMSIGPGEVNHFSEGIPKSTNTITDTNTYRTGEKIAQYHGPEWRLTFRYAVSRQSSVKASYDRSRQYIHQLSNTASVAPTDTWKLSGKHVKPQFGDQYAIGYYHNLQNGNIELSVEGFYKRMNNVLDYKTGASLLLNENIETSILQGNGKSYGLEFFLNKKSGKLNGWVSYTYSRSLLQYNSDFDIERVNDGRWFPTNFDKPHNLNISAYYKLSRRISLSTNIVYNTGRPVTYPLAQYNLAGSERIYYSNRNEFRIRDYFRTDLGLKLEGNHKIHKPIHSSLSFSVYNVLARNNPYSVFFTTEGGQIKGYELAVFAKAIPTITYNFEF